jgi:hypothetical protein
MSENSNWENQQAEDKETEGFLLISYLILWPLFIFLALHFHFKANPFWFWVVFFLFSPAIIGYRLKAIARWGGK